MVNLRTATSTLIDFARTNGHESDRELQRAIRRMEQRYAVLQLREAKNRKRTRSKAFWSAMAAFEGGVYTINAKGHAGFPCSGCKAAIFFGDFCKLGQWDGRGIVTQMICPKCALVMMPPHENGAFLQEAKT